MHSTWMKECFFAVEPEENRLYLLGRGMLLIGLVIWSWRFAVSPLESNLAGASFLHLVNLPFHEAGHIIFAPLGRFLQVFGGTMGQILIPCLCVGTFLVKSRDVFGASVSMWWLGENFLDIAPYINDARALDLLLLGGVTGKDVDGYHDWQYLLGTLGWLEYDHMIAWCSQYLGLFTMGLSITWGIWILRQQSIR